MPNAIPVLSPSWPRKERGTKEDVCEENCDPINPSRITSNIGSHLDVHKLFIYLVIYLFDKSQVFFLISYLLLIEHQHLHIWLAKFKFGSTRLPNTKVAVP